MTNPLLPARFLFRFSAPCRYREPLWSKKGAELDEGYRLVGLSELEGQKPFADVRAAWSESGIALSVGVHGKQQPPWCRASRSEDSDGLQVWIDTRDVHNVHRATRFCHRYVFLPGGSKGDNSPTSELLSIHRAKDPPGPIRGGLVKAYCTGMKDGYILDALIPAEALAGFDPTEHPRLGFTYAVIDRELGEQTFSVGSPMPYQEDPSLWATLELVR
jgi:hypothetical protein